LVPALRRTAPDDASHRRGSATPDTSATLNRFARARNDAVKLNLPDGQNTHGRDARFARRANLPQPCAIAGCPKSVAFRRVPRPLKGRFAIVTSVGRGMRWTYWCRQTSDADADGEVVWS